VRLVSDVEMFYGDVSALSVAEISAGEVTRRAYAQDYQMIASSS